MGHTKNKIFKKFDCTHNSQANTFLFNKYFLSFFLGYAFSLPWCQLLVFHQYFWSNFHKCHWLGICCQSPARSKKWKHSNKQLGYYIILFKLYYGCKEKTSILGHFKIIQFCVVK